MKTPEQRPSLLASVAEGVSVFAGDVVGGCLVITRNSLAVLGVAVTVGAVLIASQPSLRHRAETQLTAWLTQQQQPLQQMAQVRAPAPAPAPVLAPVSVPPDVEHTAVNRATAIDPRALPPEQAQLAQWIARRYQVAPEPVAALVTGAYKAGQATHIDPALILAVMAIESSFNPFAQSTAGAQGLMQVMTRVHGDKYNGYGGNLAAFDPLSNLRVGVWVLRDCINKAGSTGGGLRCYVGATHLKTDRGYADKVLAEYERLQQIIAQVRQGEVPQVSASATVRKSRQVARIRKPKPDTDTDTDLMAATAPKTSG
jgi:soluble lytic murein transglycosylase-like protein